METHIVAKHIKCEHAKVAGRNDFVKYGLSLVWIGRIELLLDESRAVLVGTKLDAVSEYILDAEEGMTN